MYKQQFVFYFICLHTYCSVKTVFLTTSDQPIADGGPHQLASFYWLEQFFWPANSRWGHTKWHLSIGWSNFLWPANSRWGHTKWHFSIGRQNFPLDTLPRIMWTTPRTDPCKTSVKTCIFVDRCGLDSPVPGIMAVDALMAGVDTTGQLIPKCRL